MAAEGPLGLKGCPAAKADQFTYPYDLAADGEDRFVLEPRPAAAALRESLDEVLGGPRVLIRPLAKRDGFAVVHEERGETGNAYQQELVARIIDAGTSVRLDFQPGDECASAVQEVFDRQLGLVHGTQVSGALVGLIETLGGTRLRPGGALYWLPGPRVAEWQEIARAIEEAAVDRPSAVYLLRHRFDEDAVRAVRDAIVLEVNAEASRIQQEVLTGELGQKALEHRREPAGELRQKVRLDEEMLDVGLAGLHRAVDQADQAAAAAALLASAQVSDIPERQSRAWPSGESPQLALRASESHDVIIRTPVK